MRWTCTQGSRTFVMEIENGEIIIENEEKGYEHVTNIRNLRLHIKGETQRHIHAFNIFRP